VAREHRWQKSHHTEEAAGSASRDQVIRYGRKRWLCKSSAISWPLLTATSDLTSSNSALHVSVYDRRREGEGFLGMLDIKPVLKDQYTLDSWYQLGTRGDEHVTGEIWIQVTFHQLRNKAHFKPSDFEFLKLIGRGTFGRVFQVRKKDTRRIYAMKVLSKKEIVAKKEVAHTIGERKILQRSLECPFLVGLKFSFQTEKELYFVTDYKCGGELFWHLQKEGRFSEDRARFYIAELILALEHLHKYNIVYRSVAHDLAQICLLTGS